MILSPKNIHFVSDLHVYGQALVKLMSIGIVLAATTAMANTVYEVDLVIDDGSVVGFVETDGTLGSLVSDNIVNWDLELFNGTDTFVVDLSNSFVAFTGPVDTIATSDTLYFNFDSDPANIAFQQMGFPGWHFGIHASNSHPATFAVGPPFEFAQSFESGVVVYALAQIDDTDGDGVHAANDNCSMHSNPDQRDTNSDGYGNVCDPDFNNDGIVNFADIAAWVPFFNTQTSGDFDLNGDGSANFLDYLIITNLFLLPPGPSGVAP